MGVLAAQSLHLHHDFEAMMQGFVGCFNRNTEDNFPPFQGVAAADLAEQASDARDCRWAKLLVQVGHEHVESQ